jgi:serine/threonine protein kinase
MSAKAQAETRGAKPMKPKPRYQPGDKIGGRYQVHRALMGGMGEVYLCLDLETENHYALKTFQVRYFDNPNFLRAFMEEIAIWVSLEKHPNIVRCFGAKSLDNRLFMILQEVQGDPSIGVDLRSWIRHGAVETQHAFEITRWICMGLEYAEQKQPGIVHQTGRHLPRRKTTPESGPDPAQPKPDRSARSGVLCRAAGWPPGIELGSANAS